MKAFFFCIAILITLSSCEKWSHLDFTFDKSEYTAGDTVRLWRQSEKGKLVWIMPDGQHQETFDGKFAIDPNMGFGELNFTLKDEAVYHLKKRSKTKTVNIIPRSSIIETNIPYSSSETLFSSNVKSNSGATNFTVSLTYDRGNLSHDWGTITFFFPAGIPAVGSYTLQNSSTTLTAFTAFVNEKAYAIDVPPWSADYVTGTVNVTYVNNKLHLYFTDIYTANGTFKLSGDVYSSF